MTYNTAFSLGNITVSLFAAFAVDDSVHGPVIFSSVPRYYLPLVKTFPLSSSHTEIHLMPTARV